MSDAAHDEDPFDSHLDLTVLAGMWADETLVHRQQRALNIDFVRHAPSPQERILVARAILAPAVAFELQGQLAEILRMYPEWPMPEGDQ
jgi:hypothetical protein